MSIVIEIKYRKKDKYLESVYFYALIDKRKPTAGVGRLESLE